MGERGVIESMLFGFLVSLELEVGDGREIVEGMGRELLEVQGWARGVFEGLGEGRGVSVLGTGRGRGSGTEGGGMEEEKVRVLAASVLVRIQGFVERYQGLLVGDLASYS